MGGTDYEDEFVVVSKGVVAFDWVGYVFFFNRFDHFSKYRCRFAGSRSRYDSNSQIT